jgi:membrane-associated phospholipid phosphatase
MTLSGRLIDLTLSGVLIVGGYQFYFWCQRNPVSEPRVFVSRLDEWIPYRPSWVWIYSFLYYPAILYINAVAQSADHFTRIACSYLLLLALQAMFFVLFPVRTPEHWRSINGRRTLSERFLAYLQRFDAPSNSFPSMHVSMAMLTALHLAPALGPAIYAFPALIGASCLLTKQHYLIDLPAGAALGWLVHQAYLMTLAA